jgi:hypothetical protein
VGGGALGEWMPCLIVVRRGQDRPERTVITPRGAEKPHEFIFREKIFGQKGLEQFTVFLDSTTPREYDPENPTQVEAAQVPSQTGASQSHIWQERVQNPIYRSLSKIHLVLKIAPTRSILVQDATSISVTAFRIHWVLKIGQTTSTRIVMIAFGPCVRCRTR